MTTSTAGTRSATGTGQPAAGPPNPAR